MRRFLLSVFLIALLRPAAAEEVGESITFAGAPAARVIQVGPHSAGASLWDSGPSDPLASDFDSLLFQGILEFPGVQFEASLRNGDGWGPWTAAEVERFPNGRFWASLPLAGKKGAVLRLRAVGESSAAGGVIELYSLEATLPASQAPWAATPKSAIAVPSGAKARKPKILPREAWGALAASQPYEPMIPDRISVHHTEAAQPMSLDDAKQELRIIQRFHQKGRGWIDIAYHFLIDGSGRIWQGRPETVVGAHVRDKNEGNIGISIKGDFHPPKNNHPTRAQIRSLILLSRWLVSAYGIDPANIKGHRDQESTSCPGDILYARLGEIRRAVGAPQAPAPEDLSADWNADLSDEPQVRILNAASPALERLGTAGGDIDQAAALRDIFDTGKTPVLLQVGGR